MKSLSSNLLLGISILFNALACGDTSSNQLDTQQLETSPLVAHIDTTRHPFIMTDPRDGESYTIVTIGAQTWMSQNLRFDAPGAILNPKNPSKAYGCLYTMTLAQIVCPQGWHLPSDTEWDELEIAHGMPVSFVGQGGWRGEHAAQMKSTHSWGDNGNGTDSLGFTVLPAGYYFPAQFDEASGIQGLGFSAAFWSAMQDDKGTARFMFSPRTFVNKWEDKENGTALSCRCVKD